MAKRIGLRFTASKLLRVDVTTRRGGVMRWLYSSLARVVRVEPMLITNLLGDTGES